MRDGLEKLVVKWCGEFDLFTFGLLRLSSPPRCSFAIGSNFSAIRIFLSILRYMDVLLGFSSLLA